MPFPPASKHEILRREAKRDETKIGKHLTKNGKFFVPPSRSQEDFKAVFRRLAAAGAGRPVDAEGLPQGPWTPDLLAEAISQMDANRKGVDLRTVQLWFQDNRKGISRENIRWLARIFGCGDPEATSDWQAELSASQVRLTAARRVGQASAPVEVSERTDGAASTPGRDRDQQSPSAPEHVGIAPGPGEGAGLALRSERLFSLGGSLNLPAFIFAGATALHFIAYLLGIHSITYVRPDGVERQVGFHWATNWTLLFMLFLPLFTIFASDLVSFWRTKGRAALLQGPDRRNAVGGWARKVRRSSATFWSVLLICLGFAGLVQWIGARLLPLRRGIDDEEIDWGSVALIRPDAVSIPEAIAFSGLAYLYMAVCFYLMFVGLILVYALVDDYWEISGTAEGSRDAPAVRETAFVILNGLFRCAVMGLMIAICMNLQHRFLSSDAPNVWTWMLRDAVSIWPADTADNGQGGNGFVMHFTSLLVALPTCAVMIYGIVRIAMPAGIRSQSFRMSMALCVIVASYLLIGAFSGFTILLAAAILIGLYGVFDPSYGDPSARFRRKGRRAS